MARPPQAATSIAGGNRLARSRLQADRRPDRAGDGAETITRSRGLARSRGDYARCVVVRSFMSAEPEEVVIG